MAKHHYYRNPETLEPVDLSGLHHDGVFTVIQAHNDERGTARFQVIAGDCAPDGGRDTHGQNYAVVYPGTAIEVWESAPDGGSLRPWIVENDGGIADVQPHRPRVTSRLRNQNVTLKPPLV